MSPLDYAVLVTYVAASIGLGAYLGRRQRTLQDYFLGGASMPWWAVSLSIVATETSTLTFIGAPAISYAGDLTFLQVAMGYCLGKILVAAVLIPSYFQGRILTVYELLRQRFGERARTAAAAIFLATRSLADGVRLFATALVLTVVTEFGDIEALVAIALATVAYTLYGGMRAVVWNDVIQLFLYLAGAALALWLLLDGLPGDWTQTLESAGAKLRIFDFDLDFSRAYTFWGGLVGGAFLTFATHGADQMMVQRYLACGKRRGSQAALVASGFIVLIQFLLFLIVGVLLFVYYQTQPLPQTLESNDRIFPLFIAHNMPAGLAGLILAAIFAAAMSTLSSSLNSLASSTLNDFYKAYFVKDASQEHYLAVSRWLTLMWAGVLTLLALLARGWGSVLEAGLAIASVTMGSVLGIFLLGIVSRRAGEVSALVGMASGLLVVGAVKSFTGVAWTWHVLIGTAATLAAGLLTQALASRRTEGGPKA